MRCAALISPERTGGALSRDAGQPGEEISLQCYPHACTSDHCINWITLRLGRAFSLEDVDVGVLLGGIGELKRRRAEVSRVILKGLQKEGWVLRAFYRPHV